MSQHKIKEHLSEKGFYFNYTDPTAKKYQSSVPDDLIFFSIKNENIIKIGKWDTLFVTKSFNEEVYNIFEKFPHSTSIFSNGIRKNMNWIATNGWLQVDVDNGITMQEATKTLKEHKDGWSHYLIPSKSHQKEKNGTVCDRFHAYIYTGVIKNRSLYHQLHGFFRAMLKGDRQTSDLARFFSPNPYLNQNDIVFWNEGKNTIQMYFNERVDSEIKYTTDIIYEHIKQSPESKNNDIDKKALQLWLELIKNLHPYLIFDHYNESNSSMNWRRNHTDSNPGLFCFYDSNIIIDQKTDTKYNIIYSLKDFNEAELPKIDETQEKISKILEEIRDFELSSNTGKLTVLKTNEGTGKTLCICKQAKRGDIIIAQTKSKLQEISVMLDEFYKTHRQIFSNSDIIYNVLATNRENDFDARDIVKKYEKFFQTNKRKERLDTMSKEEIECEEKWCNNISSTPITQEIYDDIIKKMNEERLSNNKIEISEDEGKTIREIIENEEDQTSSIAGFLKKYKNLFLDGEPEMILAEYSNQLFDLLSRSKIYIMTTQKFATYIQYKSKLFRGDTVFADECLYELYSPGKIIEKAKSRNFLNYTTKAYHQKIHEPKEKEPKFFISETYKNYYNTIKFEELSWLNNLQINLIIITTENLASQIHKDVNLIDLTHKIIEPKISILLVDGMNKKIDNEKVFSGEEKIQFIKSLVNEELEVDLNNIIAEGLGCKWNHNNSKGMNSFKNEIIKNNSKTMGIIMTNPHPDTIDKKKVFSLTPGGLVDSSLKEKNIPITHINRSEELNSKQINNLVKKIHVSDILNQDIGRICGYRDTQCVDKIYVVLPISLLEYISEVNYLTPNIFSYTRMFNCVDLQRKFPKEWEFLQKVQMINSKTYNNDDINFTKWLDHKTEYIKKHIENKALSAIKYSSFYVINTVKKSISNMIIILRRTISSSIKKIGGRTAECGGILGGMMRDLGNKFFFILKDYSKGYEWDEILENS